MTKVVFYPDPKNMETSFLAAWNTAGILLVELVKAKGGGGQWFDDLKLQMETAQLGRQDGFDLPPGTNLSAAQTAYGDTVRSIFDRIRFTNDPDEATTDL